MSGQHAHSSPRRAACFTVIQQRRVSALFVLRIEETWRLWCKFLEDYSRFEDWLKTAELTAASPDSADVLYTSAKEELKKFEVRKKQNH